MLNHEWQFGRFSVFKCLNLIYFRQRQLLLYYVKHKYRLEWESKNFHECSICILVWIKCCNFEKLKLTYTGGNWLFERKTHVIQQFGQQWRISSSIALNNRRVEVSWVFFCFVLNDYIDFITLVDRKHCPARDQKNYDWLSWWLYACGYMP